MALPIYDREQGKLLPKDKSGSSSLPGGLAPNPKGGLPVFVRPEVKIVEPVEQPTPPMQPSPLTLS